ncbi:hypothetical protein [Candidatus Allofournierella merdavium]|uniref:hypothetical protein n=1 Tax=Candidatus Allofournierella merdavium TaxID=2838593 RepID=UPI00374FDB7B
MKHTTKQIALCLAAALASVAVLTACSGGAESTAPASGSTASASGSGSAAHEASQETVMGMVSYVGSDYISMTRYTGGEEATDYAALDVSGLTATQETVSVDTTDATEYLKAESGMLSAAAREDVTTGAFIVSTYDENGTHQIILLPAAASSDESTSGSAAENTETDSTASVSEAQESASAASGEQESASVASGEGEAADASESAVSE